MADKPDQPNDHRSGAFHSGELPKDPRQLLGGYATGTLNPRERQYLMNAALENQDLFDELQDEVALKQALDAPGVRRRLLAKLDREQPQPAVTTPSTAGAPAAIEANAGSGRWRWGAAGLAAAALMALTFVLLAPPPQNPELAQNVAQRESQAAAQLEAPATPEPAPVPAGTQQPALQPAPTHEVTAAAAVAPNAATPTTVVKSLPVPAPAPSVAPPRPVPQALTEPQRAADQAPPQLRAAATLEGAAVSQSAAGGAPLAAQSLVFNGQPVLPALLRRAGTSGMAYQIVGRTLVFVSSENGYLTVTEGTGNEARDVLPAEQPVMSGTPVTIALGEASQPITISFARKQGAPAVQARPGEAVMGSVELPTGVDSRVTITVPR